MAVRGERDRVHVTVGIIIQQARCSFSDSDLVWPRNSFRVLPDLSPCTLTVMSKLAERSWLLSLLNCRQVTFEENNTTF